MTHHFKFTICPWLGPCYGGPPTLVAFVFLKTLLSCFLTHLLCFLQSVSLSFFLSILSLCNSFFLTVFLSTPLHFPLSQYVCFFPISWYFFFSLSLFLSLSLNFLSTPLCIFVLFPFSFSQYFSPPPSSLLACFLFSTLSLLACLCFFSVLSSTSLTFLSDFFIVSFLSLNMFLAQHFLSFFLPPFFFPLFIYFIYFLTLVFFSLISFFPILNSSFFLSLLFHHFLISFFTNLNLPDCVSVSFILSLCTKIISNSPHCFSFLYFFSKCIIIPPP
ncbi:ZDHHC9_14_18 [Acanthosepion pharaonis]|uniref:ZDHHC9_14_18 n=1 Tax=Acanthosepion pharaonis TaxID=158019 RepID=A0A812C746_ACAPH|nr:ZDHHC9_14_18 [Sepia pharaonis]